MNIVLDMDEVIVQWLSTVLEYYNIDHKTSFTREDIKSWNIVDSLPNSHHFLRSVMRYVEFYRDLLPVEGAIAGVKKLLDDGHDVVIATAVPKCAGISYHGKLEWIRRNMPFFDLNNFIAIQRKDLLSSWGDVLFDDGLHNVIPWAKSDYDNDAVVLDAPWNRSLEDDFFSIVTRVKHWNQFLKFIEDKQKHMNSLPRPAKAADK